MVVQHMMTLGNSKMGHSHAISTLRYWKEEGEPTHANEKHRT